MYKMAQAKETEKPIDLTEKITLYAPEKPLYHKPFEEVEVHPMQKEHFLSHGFTVEKPEPKKDKPSK